MVLYVPGEGGRAFATRLAQQAAGEVADVEFKTFPDGEQYARIRSALAGKDVVVVETGFPPSRLWSLLLLLDAARENKAASVRAVVPYMPYARQDRRFLDGEPVTARLVAELLSPLTSSVLTVDLHKDDVKSHFRVPCMNLSASPAFGREFKSRGVEVVLAPDAGAEGRAREVATQIGARHDHLEKKRLSGTEVVMTPKSLDVRGRTVAILDDIISTGGTMAKATEQLVAQGARRVICAGVHGLFIGDAVAKLQKAGANEILCTDTIESEFSHVSVADLVARALQAPAAVRKAR